MKSAMTTLYVLAALVLTATSAQAQTANSTSQAGAQANSASQSGAFARAGGGNASNAASFKSPRQAGAIGMAGLAASSGCMGSTSVGGGFIGGSFGIGSTWQDDRCNAREDARLLAAFGYRREALSILVNNSPMVRQAFFPTGASAGALPAPGRSYNSGCQKWAGGNVGGQCLY